MQELFIYLLLLKKKSVVNQVEGIKLTRRKQIDSSYQMLNIWYVSSTFKI